MITNNPKFGITGPLSTEKIFFKKLTDSLETYLKNQNIYETENELIERERVLGKINFLFNNFVKGLGKEDKALSKIFTFGSYRLGVHQKNADIDTLCVAPKYVKRDMFFKEFPKILRDNGFIVDSVEDAFVPLLQLSYKVQNQYFDESIEFEKAEDKISNEKSRNDEEKNEILSQNKDSNSMNDAKRMKKNEINKINSNDSRSNESESEMKEIKIDLVFARLNLNKINENLNLSDSTLLKNLDEKSVLSLNGNRVADDILNLVPNISVFHGALKCIKYWSKRKQINGHLFGYPGGIAYAILVARICQFFPNFDIFNIIKKFFFIYKDWKWPFPVMLNKIVDLNYNYKVWDPSNPSDKFHKMPIITPSYPAMCSTHNIFNSSLKRFKEECTRAYEIICKIENSQEVDENNKLKDDEKNSNSSDKNDKESGEINNVTANEILKSNNEVGNKKVDQSNKESIKNIEFNNFKSLDLLWSQFFKQTDFFQKYKSFLSVFVITRGKNSHYKSWQGHVFSKLRILASKLESLDICESAPSFPKFFEITKFFFEKDYKLDFLTSKLKDDDQCSVAFIGLEINNFEKRRISFIEPIREFKEIIFDWRFKDGSEQVLIEIMKRKNVNLFLKRAHEVEKQETMK